MLVAVGVVAVVVLIVSEMVVDIVEEVVMDIHQFALQLAIVDIMVEVL